MRLIVLDLTRLLPGGYATHLLREMGARIIKIEEPSRGDYLRDFPFPLEDGMSAYFHAINRGKQSVCVDLKTSPDNLLALARHADVLVEGFRPGVMDRLGVGYDSVSKVNRGIVYCSLLGYPSSGGHRDRAGHDVNYLGLSGLLDINRGQDGKPAMPGLQIADVASGSLFAVARILQAVIERAERGRGERIEIDMLSGTASLMSFMAGPTALARKNVRWEDLLLNGQVACYNLYPTSDARWVSMGNLEEKFWQTFCRAIDREPWIPKQFDKSAEFRLEVSSVFQQQTLEYWMKYFRNVDTCIEPVLTLNEAAERGLFRYPSDPAPRLGQHTDAVLREFSSDNRPRP